MTTEEITGETIEEITEEITEDRVKDAPSAPKERTGMGNRHPITNIKRGGIKKETSIMGREGNRIMATDRREGTETTGTGRITGTMGRTDTTTEIIETIEKMGRIDTTGTMGRTGTTGITDRTETISEEIETTNPRTRASLPPPPKNSPSKLSPILTS